MRTMRYGLYLGATAIACAWSGFSTPVNAQGAPAANPLPMFDSVTAMGQALAQSGIYLSLDYIEDFSWLTTGGQPGKTGGHPIGHATAGATFDPDPPRKLLDRALAQAPAQIERQHALAIHICFQRTQFLLDEALCQGLDFLELFGDTMVHRSGRHRNDRRIADRAVQGQAQGPGDRSGTTGRVVSQEQGAP